MRPQSPRGRLRLPRHSSHAMSVERRDERLRSLARRRRTIPLMPERLEDRTLLTGNPFSSIATELGLDLQSIQKNLDQALNAATAIPFLDHAVGNLVPVETFLDQARTSVIARLGTLGTQASDPTDDQIQQAFLDALGPSSAADLLADLGSDGVGLDDVQVTHTADGFTVEMRLHEAEVATTTTGFSIGLPSLPIKLDTKASFSVMAGVDYELAFHYNAAANTTTLDPTKTLADFQGTGPAHEFAVSLDTVVAPDQFKASASIGFLQGMLAPTAGLDTSFHGSLAWDGLSSPTPATVDATANVNMTLSGGFGGGADFPMIGAEFHLSWKFDSSDPLGNAPQVSFDHVGLDLGGFISGILSPIINGLAPYLEPLKEPLAVLGERLPGISDISELLGDGPVSLLTLASAAGDQSGYGPLVALVNAIVPLITAVTNLTSEVHPGDVSIPLGGFDLSGDDGDLRAAPAAGDVNDLSLTHLTNLIAKASAIGIDQITQDPGVSAGAAAVLNQLIAPSGSIHFDFPILTDPADAVFGLILGKDSDLASFDAKIHLAADSNKAPQLSFAGFGINVTATATVDAEFRFAYDTFGIRKLIGDLSANPNTAASALALDVADGFYIDDTSHLTLGGSIGLSAGYQFGPLGFSLDGDIGTGADGRGTDPNQAIRIGVQGGSDGKVRFKDFNSHTLTLHGELVAGLSATLKVGVDFLGTFIGFEHTFDIASQVLLILNSDAPPIIPRTDQLAVLLPDGKLELDIGSPDEAGDADSDNRVIYDAANNPITSSNVTSTTSDDYTIRHVSQEGDTETVDVTDEALGATERISGVRSIYCSNSGGYASDVRTIDVEDGVTSPATLQGGSGHADLTYSGTGMARLNGGALSSTLVGGMGLNVLIGGNGDDKLVGGPSGTNYISGGKGNNTVIIQAAEGSIGSSGIFSGGPNPNNTLIVVEPLGSATTNIRSLGGGQLSVMSHRPNTAPAGKASNESTIALIAANFSKVVVGGNHGYSDVTVGDFGGSGLTSLGLDLVTGGAFYVNGARNHVTVDGAPGGVAADGSPTEDVFTTSTDVDPSTADAYSQVELTQGASDFYVNIDGLGLAGALLTLDGEGGLNHYNVAPNPDDLHTTSIQDTGPNPGDGVAILGGLLPAGSVDVTDAEVEFSYYPRQFVGHTYTATVEVDLDSHVGDLTVYAPLGVGTSITASRNIGSTTLQESKGAITTFIVSGSSDYTLIGDGYYDDYNVTLPTSIGVSSTSQTTISDLDSGGTGTLVVNDPGSIAYAYSNDLLTPTSITRTAIGLVGTQFVRATSSVTFDAP